MKLTLDCGCVVTGGIRQWCPTCKGPVGAVQLYQCDHAEGCPVGADACTRREPHGDCGTAGDDSILCPFRSDLNDYIRCVPVAPARQTCRWTRNADSVWLPTCTNVLIGTRYADPYAAGWAYCPYCGKTILTREP